MLSVPVQAVVSYNGQDHVAVRKSGGVIELREVSIGLSNGKFAEITNGIEDGDNVLLNTTAFRKDEPKHERVSPPTPSAPRIQAPAPID